MLLKTILNRVEPHKSFVYGKTALTSDEDGRLALEVDDRASRATAARSAPAATAGDRATTGCRRGGSSSCRCGGSPCSSSTRCGAWTARGAG